MRQKFSLDSLFAFIDTAGAATYAAGKPPEPTSQRPDFIEYTFTQANWHYRDSYTGHTKSAGQEVVRYKGEIVWINSYSGGMLPGYEDKAKATFTFLKQALSQPEPNFQSLRGPKHFSAEDWQYRYSQHGNLTDFYGYEEILHQGEPVFFHRTIGGTVDNR